MSRLVVVVGATGMQGGSVVDSLLKDSQYRVRAITRNPDSDSGKALKAKGTEVVSADLNDEPSLARAFDGAYAIFAVTNFFEPVMTVGVEEARKIEYQQGINMVNAAKKVPTLKHYLWSTLPNSSALSKGKYNVHFFDVKSSVDDYIRQDRDFLAKTTFLYLTFFAKNMFYPVYVPIHLKPADKLAQLLPLDGETPLDSIGDASINTGIFVRSILNNPPKTGGTYLLLCVDSFTFQSYLDTWGEATGFAKEKGSVSVVQISLDAYRKLWPGFGDLMGEMNAFWAELRERSWETPLGKQPTRAQELMTEADKKLLQPTAKAFQVAAADFKSAIYGSN